jgi:ATP-dependent DNA ligase
VFRKPRQRRSCTALASRLRFQFDEVSRILQTRERTRNPDAASYLSTMPRRPFEPCLPTRGTKVLTGPDWIHEIKHDGYRLIVQKDHERVRLFTRNGHDWTDRYPLIVKAALKNRSSSFVIDGEAVLLGVDGVSDSRMASYILSQISPYSAKSPPPNNKQPPG